ncbi:MAG: hypothetical protein ACLQFR_16590 [Streptosporangiaceae bacterium]
MRSHWFPGQARRPSITVRWIREIDFVRHLCERGCYNVDHQFYGTAMRSDARGVSFRRLAG